LKYLQKVFELADDYSFRSRRIRARLPSTRAFATVRRENGDARKNHIF
jgi:hypothetical protein